MKTISKLPVPQGDVLIIRREAGFRLPAGLEEVPPENGLVIVAHSETGHHHAIDVDATNPGAVTLFRVPGDQMTTYLRLRTPRAEIRHHRAWDTHETLETLAHEGEGETIFEIKRQQEPTPDGWAKVQD